MEDRAFIARIVCEDLPGSSEALARQIEEKTEFLDALRAHMNKPEESSEETKMNEEEQRKREESRREREDAEYDLEYRTASAAKKTKTSGVKLQDAKQSGTTNRSRTRRANIWKR